MVFVDLSILIPLYKVSTAGSERDTDSLVRKLIYIGVYEHGFITFLVVTSPYHGMPFVSKILLTICKPLI